MQLCIHTVYHTLQEKTHHVSHGLIIFYQHLILMNSVLFIAIQTKRCEKEHAAGWLQRESKCRKAQDWKSREFIPSRRRTIFWKCSLLTYNIAVINKKLCIYFKIKCTLTCLSQCVMSTEFVSTTGSVNPDESPQPLSMVWNALFTGLLNICNAVDMQSVLFETATA